MIDEGSLFLPLYNNYYKFRRVKNTRRHYKNRNEYLSPRKTARDDLFFYFISASFHSLAIDNNRRLWVWGWNHEGQLGLGDNNPRNIPSMIEDFSF